MTLNSGAGLDTTHTYTVKAEHRALVDLESASSEVTIKLDGIEMVVTGADLRKAGNAGKRPKLSEVAKPQMQKVVKARHAPSRIATIDAGDRDYYDSLGPWVRGSDVAEKLGRSLETLSNWRKKNELLGVGFGDKKLVYYYPVQQFMNGRPVSRLKQVLDALAPGFVTEASRAAWLALPAYEEGEATRWDLLRRGHAELVASWAADDAERLTTA